MTQRWILRALGVVTIMVVFLMPAHARQKQIKWELTIGNDPADEQAQVLCMPSEVMADQKGDIYVLQKESIEKFDRNGNHLLSIALKKGKGPGEFSGPASLVRDDQGNLYVWDEFLTRVSKLDRTGKFISSAKIGSMFKKMARWGKNELVFLGLSQDHILHVYSEEGKEVKSFGAPFDPVPDIPAFATSPMEWFVDGDSIWVPNPLSYEIRQYVSEKLIHTIKGPDNIPKPSIKEGKGFVGVAFTKGIFGMAAYNGKLLAHAAIDAVRLDVFDIKTGQLFSRIECRPRLRSSDRNGRLYFVDEGKVRVGRLE